MQILAICGSLQAQSANLSLLRAAAAAAPEGVEIVLFDGLRALPHFDPDLEAVGVPPAVSDWRRAIAASDALLIATPEYGHSLPGALKNAIDWVIGSGELEGKVVAITAAVPGPERGRRGLAALRDTLGAVSAVIVSSASIVKGTTMDQDVAALVRELVDRARRLRSSPGDLRRARTGEEANREDAKTAKGLPSSLAASASWRFNYLCASRNVRAGMRARSYSVVAALFLVACAPSPTHVDAPPKATVAFASAIVSVPANAGVGASTPPSPVAMPAEVTLPDLVAALTEGEISRAVADELGRPIGADDLQAVAREDGVHLSVRGPDRAAAVAACRVWWRVAEQRFAEGRAPSRRAIDDEQRRLVREIAELDRSLGISPALDGDLPRSRAEALTTARVRKLQADLAETHGEDAIEGAFPVLAALARLVLSARGEAARVRARGLGSSHPDAEAADARVTALDRRRVEQRATERDAARRAVAALEAAPAADRSAYARLFRDRLVALELAAVAAGDPIGLQLAAIERASLDAEDAQLAVRYGSQHPRRVALRARQAAVDASFDRDRRMYVADLSAAMSRGAPPPSELDRRPGELRERAVMLAATLARLEAWADTLPSSRWAVVAPCHGD